MPKASYPELLNLPATGPLFGQLMLRDLLLPDLLGKETETITYWAGRSLARRLPVAEGDLPALFARIGFGELTASTSKRHQRLYTLSGTTVATRMANFDAPDFRLEAGFLAQSLQQTFGCVVEASAAVDMRKQVVTLTVILDEKTPQPKAESQMTLADL
ncbi:DUF2507 domain-containing protein [Lacticaseibacillus baoqingensis]|uniref:DUF2507 domain-containing protein n=1 Tax=Lacticaseibacillus baoqingensis TaxID=2486013 RepID=A0ABW4E9I1_9LACO|nr:DUF2507 domain-containing protein [Lacticaseibacillus baoqingensis]